MIGRPSPSASAREAKLCRMSWMRTSCSSARARMVSQAASMSVMCVPGLAPGMTQGLPGLARQVREDADRRRGQVNRARASFPIGEVNLGRVEIDMLPAQGQDFVSAAARQHQQADRRDRAGRYPAALARGLVQHLPEAGELRVGQEPLAPTFGVHRDELAGIIAVLGRHVPAPGERVHVAQGLDRHGSPSRGSRTGFRAAP